MDASATTIATETTALPNKEQSFVRFWYPSLIACYFIVSIAITMGNLLTIVAYWTSPSLQKRLHNLLICNLSTADLLVAFVGTAAYLFNLTEAGSWYISTHKYACLVIIFSIASTVNLSLAAISLLCLDRFIAVTWPYRYYRIVTDKSVRVAIAVSSVFSFTPTILPLLGWNKWKSGNLCGTFYVHPKALVNLVNTSRFVIIGLTVIMNVCIAKITYNRSKSSVADSQSQARDNKDVENQSQAATNKVTKMILTIFGVYYVCWIPFMVLTIMYRKNTDRSTGFIIAQDYAKLLVGVNSCINPIIYSKVNAEFREAFKKKLRRIFCRHAESADTSK